MEVFSGARYSIISAINMQNVLPQRNVMQLFERIEDGLKHKIILFSAMNIADKAWQNISEITIKTIFVPVVSPNQNFLLPKMKNMT